MQTHATSNLNLRFRELKTEVDNTIETLLDDIKYLLMFRQALQNAHDRDNVPTTATPTSATPGQVDPLEEEMKALARKFAVDTGRIER